MKDTSILRSLGTLSPLIIDGRKKKRHPKNVNYSDLMGEHFDRNFSERRTGKKQWR